MILRLLWLALLSVPVVRSDDLGISDSLGQLEVMNRALTGHSYDKSCWTDPEASGKTCNQTSDEFCRRLWDEGDGNLKVFDGVVRAGSSPKSGLSYAQLDDYRALAASLPRLPKDLAKEARPAVQKLQKLLGEESGTKTWKRAVAQAYAEFTHAVEDVKEARAKNNDADDDTLEAEIVKAKYARSANWKRVERLFPQAKEDLLRVIDDLEISSERKEHMRERVRTVTLKLPDGSDDCGTTQENAMYSPESHTFTVCAGLFNSYATDSGLYQTIAHEISHSIDPGAEALNDNRKAGLVARTLNQLKGAKGPAIACNLWIEQAHAVLMRTPAQAPLRSELDPFYACLESRKVLKPWDPASVESVADLRVKQAMSKLAKSHTFLRLAQPTFTEQGEEKPNPAYLRPDKIEFDADDDGKAGKANKKNKTKKALAEEIRDANLAEIFTQALACEKETQTGKPFPDVKSPPVRRELFRQALEMTSSLMKQQKLELYTVCGQNCEELVEPGLARDPSENFADWMANRASRFLYARIDTKEHRQESAALGNALLCDEAGPKREAPGLAAEEKKFSTEEHPDERTRRISEYDPFVAHQLGCTLSPNQGFALCQP